MLVKNKYISIMFIRDILGVQHTDIWKWVPKGYMEV